MSTSEILSKEPSKRPVSYEPHHCLSQALCVMSASARALSFSLSGFVLFHRYQFVSHPDIPVTRHFIADELRSQSEARSLFPIVF
jgi:hypothetical protein